jgi:chromosome segregation ATPase
MQLEQLNRSMAELVALLRESTERQRLEILLKRIELHHLDLEPLQEELRRARADKVSQEEEQMRLQALLNDLDDQAASKEPEVLQPSDPEQRSIRHGLEVQIKFLKGRIESAERKVAELENELADKRRQIDLLERMIDDRLRAWVR